MPIFEMNFGTARRKTQEYGQGNTAGFTAYLLVPFPSYFTNFVGRGIALASPIGIV